MKPSTAAILSILEHCGPLTMRDIAEFFPDVNYRLVASFITAMRSVSVKHLHIQSWTMEGRGRRYPRPIYALGNKRDAPKPKRTTTSERMKKYRQSKKLPKAANSVFNLASHL